VREWLHWRPWRDDVAGKRERRNNNNNNNFIEENMILTKYYFLSNSLLNVINNLYAFPFLFRIKGY
jgi:hypothetical protein